MSPSNVAALYPRIPYSFAKSVESKTEIESTAMFTYFPLLRFTVASCYISH